MKKSKIPSLILIIIWSVIFVLIVAGLINVLTTKKSLYSLFKNHGFTNWSLENDNPVDSENVALSKDFFFNSEDITAIDFELVSSNLTMITIPVDSENSSNATNNQIIIHRVVKGNCKNNQVPTFYKDGNVLKSSIPNKNNWNVFDWNFGIMSCDIIVEVPISKCLSDISLDIVSGDVRISDIKTDVLTFNSVSGDVIIDGSFLCAKCNTVSGDINFSSIIPLTSKSTFGSVSGDLILSLAKKSKYTVQFSSVSGDFTNTILSSTISASGKTESTTQINGGGIIVKCDTVSGDVTIN